MADEFAEARAVISDMIARLTKLGGQIADVESRVRQSDEERRKVELVSADNEAKSVYLGRLIRQQEQHGPDAGPPPVEST